MDQKQRNKIAWILAVVLAPLLIYLLLTNIPKVRKSPSPPAPAVLGVSPSPSAGVVTPGTEVQPPSRPATGESAAAGRSAASIDPKILAEQKRITALLPENNPFNPARSIVDDSPPITAPPTTTTPPPITATPPPAAPDTGIKLTAILSRGGGRMAMINGRFLGEGDHITGWTIIKVNPRDVLLKNGDRQMVLRLK